MSVECKVEVTYSNKFNTEGEAVVASATLAGVLNQPLAVETFPDGNVNVNAVCQGRADCLIEKLGRAGLEFPDDILKTCQKKQGLA